MEPPSDIPSNLNDNLRNLCFAVDQSSLTYLIGVDKDEQTKFYSFNATVNPFNLIALNGSQDLKFTEQPKCFVYNSKFYVLEKTLRYYNEASSDFKTFEIPESQYSINTSTLLKTGSQPDKLSLILNSNSSSCQVIKDIYTNNNKKGVECRR